MKDYEAEVVAIVEVLAKYWPSEDVAANGRKTAAAYSILRALKERGKR